jgi:hypothetical protein
VVGVLREGKKREGRERAMLTKAAGVVSNVRVATLN